MRLLVTGATGGTGQAIVRQAIERGYEVTALVRDGPAAARVLSGATLVVGDALDEDTVFQALAGCDAVISAFGTRKVTFISKVTVNSASARALAAAMKRRGIARLVCITGLGAGDSAGHGGFVYDWLIKPTILRTIYHDKDRQEAVVRASGLDWVTVRPTILTDQPGTGRVRALTDLTGFHGGDIARADVAAFVLDQTENNRWLRQTPLITQAK